jgi:hypothetical protein
MDRRPKEARVAVRIKFGNQIVNTDHIAHAHFYPEGDGSTTYVTPCVVITFTGGKQLVVFPHDDNPEAVWDLITRGAQTPREEISPAKP